MHPNTAKVVLEGPTGEERTIENVESMVTADDGSINVQTADAPDIEEVGWDWTIRDVYVTWDPSVSEGERVTFTADGTIQSGTVKHVNGDEIVVSQMPDGYQISIDRSQIIPQ